MTDFNDFKQFVLTADSRSLVEQLSRDVKQPLGSAHNLVHMLAMMQQPSEAMQQKIDSGELNAAEMLEQLTELIGQAFDCIDYYRQILNDG